MDGWLNLYKPVGISSAHVINQVKKLLPEKVSQCKKLKIGHCGTLDPMAEGVLPLALGEATKLVRVLVDAKKKYLFTIKFGAKTASGDSEGNIVSTTNYIPSEEECLKVVRHFIGEIEQIPPIFSAIKINGVRAYKIARNKKLILNQSEAQKFCHSKTVPEHQETLNQFQDDKIHRLIQDGYKEEIKKDTKSLVIATEDTIIDERQLVTTQQNRLSTDDLQLKSRLITIYDLKFVSYDKQKQTATYIAECSKGTYIRTLAEDISLYLQSLGFVVELKRLKVGIFTAENAVNLSDLETKVEGINLTDKVVKLETILDDIPVLDADNGQATKIKHGQRCFFNCSDLDFVWIRHEAKLLAIGSVQNNLFHYLRVFN